jgi:hypothetical protein
VGQSKNTPHTRRRLSRVSSPRFPVDRKNSFSITTFNVYLTKKHVPSTMAPTTRNRSKTTSAPAPVAELVKTTKAAAQKTAKKAAAPAKKATAKKTSVAKPAAKKTEEVAEPEQKKGHVKFDSDNEGDAEEPVAVKADAVRKEEPEAEENSEDEDSDDEAPETVSASSGKEAAKKKEEEAKKAIEAYTAPTAQVLVMHALYLEFPANSYTVRKRPPGRSGNEERRF